jgi:D-alanyl-D-alanine carboxypeptidase
MLPSGNDAAIALAEHFGPMFDPREDGLELND